MLVANRNRVVSRTELLDEVLERAGDHRLVTVVGPGGIGKTHLLHHVGSVGHVLAK